ncbi:polysaccharide pyruvyl transferase family protein [Mycoplana dimorpha]|uniref:Polysaccharide pyruvyl transferase n=1 Tax=Mycoplana dimorpha TaxID=28320 RepID=A0A2T5BB06_MYCDI|nr:polysaccharide pyruvyl transferase [Mycoplana dimorpha]
MIRTVGVLTFHRCINYGSYWQARCLVEGLRERGLQAYILDHRSARIDRKEWRCALHPQRPALSGHLDADRHAAKVRKFLRAISALPLSDAFGLEGNCIPQGHDLVLVGSDEVWNLRHPWYGGQPLFYGDGLSTGRLASYAASFGNQNASDGLGKDWCRRLRRFEHVSVRDSNSKRMVDEALGRSTTLVLDPCLQFAPHIKSEAALPADWPYLALYGHGFTGQFGRAVRLWADRRSIPVVSIGYRNDWADSQWIDAGPDDFAAFMANATAIATNFFHGCVFALLNQRPYICEPSSYRSNKVCDLAQAIGADNRVISKETPAGAIAALLDAPPGRNVAQRIADLRRASSEYLDRVLH